MSAPEPPVWTLLGQLVGVLSAIRVANGYRTNIGANVYRELEQIDLDPDELPLPFIVVATSDDINLSELTTQRARRDFEVAANVFIEADISDAQQLAHAALEDLTQALPATRRYEHGDGVVSDLTLTRGVIQQRAEGLPVIVVSAVMSVVMQGQRAAPAVPAPVPP